MRYLKRYNKRMSNLAQRDTSLNAEGAACGCEKGKREPHSRVGEPQDE
jgi:hypothetical protein